MGDKELIERLETSADWTDLDTEACRLAAARLTALAEENERFKAVVDAFDTYANKSEHETGKGDSARLLEALKALKAYHRAISEVPR